MKKAYKTEINPTYEQKQKINQTIGVCRFVYNFYLAHNKEVYEKEKRFVSGMEFSKWLNNKYLPSNPQYSWIKDVSSKAVKQAIMNAEKAFLNFFKGRSGFPKFKKKRNQDVKAYFPKNNQKDLTVERHRVKIPTLGFVRLKEKGYISVNAKATSVTVSMKANRYYVSVLVDDEKDYVSDSLSKEGVGVDLGIKDFAILNNRPEPFKNINKTVKIKKLEKKLRREQRRLSRKHESFKKQKSKIREEVPVTRKNIQKQIVVVQKIHQKLANIRVDYTNYVVHEIVKTKPSFVTIEDLNVRGMMKNRHLAKAIAGQSYGLFRIKLTNKCRAYGIELRAVSRFYPSSKLCSCCGSIKKDLRLQDRIYRCNECGFQLDRDKNASINLANAKIYKIA